MLALQQRGPDVLLPVAVQPRAARNAVAGLYGNRLKLSLTAPPVEGAANDACLRLLADLLEVSRSRLSLIKGSKARHKLVCIANTSTEEVRARLQYALPDLDL
jgi:uncharacterized protein (TIGR00251 family)